MNADSPSASFAARHLRRTDAEFTFTPTARKVIRFGLAAKPHIFHTSNLTSKRSVSLGYLLESDAGSREREQGIFEKRERARERMRCESERGC